MLMWPQGHLYILRALNKSIPKWYCRSSGSSLPLYGVYLIAISLMPTQLLWALHLINSNTFKRCLRQSQRKVRSDFGAVWQIMKYLDICYRTHFTSIVKRKKIQRRLMYSGMPHHVDWPSMIASFFGVVGVVTTLWAGQSRVWFQPGTRELSSLKTPAHPVLSTHLPIKWATWDLPWSVLGICALSRPICLRGVHIGYSDLLYPYCLTFQK